jgi:SAM-dependent methyltransferase
MTSRSWLMLEPDPPGLALPDDLRDRDPLHGRDCGWVSQMRPFVRAFSRPGDVVFDPFCGFGTTLLAASLEGRRGLGMEIDPDRVALARERLQRHGLDAEILCGTLPEARLRSRIDLCLTNVPYFGCDWTGDARVGQLYRAPDFAMYLMAMHAIFHAVRDALPDGGHCIAMVQNARLGDRTVPQAWELARLLGSLFEPCEERVLLYPAREAAPSTDDDPARTDRSHEHALVFRKRRPRLDIDGARALVRHLCDEGHALRVHGSFLPWQDGDPAAGTPLPGDVDAHVTADPERFRALLQALVRLGFRLSLWGDPVNADVRPDTVHRHHYLRAERLQGEGRWIGIDLSPRDGD